MSWSPSYKDEGGVFVGRSIRSRSFRRKRESREWADHAKRFLKAELKRAGVTYDELARRLEAHGFSETEASITMKLKRGTFAAARLLACLAALEMEGIRLEDL